MSWEAELAARLYSNVTYKPSKIGQTDLDFGSNELIYCLACRITSLYTTFIDMAAEKAGLSQHIYTYIKYIYDT